MKIFEISHQKFLRANLTKVRRYLLSKKANFG